MLGKFFFEDLLAKSHNPRKIKKNRLRTYKNSKNYFFRSLWDENLPEEQFIVGEIIEKNEEEEKLVFVRKEIADLAIKKQGDWLVIDTEKEFAFANKKIITKYRLGILTTYATGYLKPLKGRIIFDRRGVIINSDEIEESGFWANQRVANLLPIK